MNETLAIDRPTAAPGAVPPPEPTPVEIEIKLAASPAMLDALRDHPLLTGAATTEVLATTYFDTATRALAKAGASLRIRRRANGCEQTLKLAMRRKHHIQRGEWNQPLAEGTCTPTAAAFPRQAREALSAIIGKAPLVPYAQVAVTRETRQVRFGESLIEIAFDVGTISGGAPDRSVLVAEIELELVHGHLADLLALALELPLGPGLHWSIATKAQRAQALAQGAKLCAVNSTPSPLAPGMTVARGFQAIGWACLCHLLGNYPLVIERGDAEALHQSRVAIRRLRAGFALFARGVLVGDATAKVLRDGLRTAATAMGPARDIHVLRQRLQAQGAAIADAAGQHLLAQLATEEAMASDAARAMLAGEVFQRLLLRLALWLEAGEWLENGPTANEPLNIFAAQVLDHQRKRVKGMRKRLAGMSDEALHDLRIDVKKLRYAVGFFGPLGSGSKAARDHERALGAVQDALGDVHDAAVAQTVFGWGGPTELFTALPLAEAQDLRLRLSEALAHTASQRPVLIAEARRSLAAEREAAGWWHTHLTDQE